METPSSITAAFTLGIATGVADTMLVSVPVILPTVLVILAIARATQGTFVRPLTLRELGRPILRIVLPLIADLDLLPTPLGRVQAIDPSIQHTAQKQLRRRSLV